MTEQNKLFMGIDVSKATLDISINNTHYKKKGLQYNRAHPNRIHAFAKASNHFAKTDKLDAILLEKVYTWLP